MDHIAALLLLVSASLAGASQVILKLAAMREYKNALLRFANPEVIIAYCILFFCMLVTVYALRYVDYKYSSAYGSVSFVVVMSLSAVVLREPFSAAKVAGCALILGGIVVFSL